MAKGGLSGEEVEEALQRSPSLFRRGSSSAPEAYELDDLDLAHEVQLAEVVDVTRSAAGSSLDIARGRGRERHETRRMARASLLTLSPSASVEQRLGSELEIEQEREQSEVELLRVRNAELEEEVQRLRDLLGQLGEERRG